MIPRWKVVITKDEINKCEQLEKCLNNFSMKGFEIYKIEKEIADGDSIYHIIIAVQQDKPNPTIQ